MNALVVVAVLAVIAPLSSAVPRVASAGSSPVAALVPSVSVAQSASDTTSTVAPNDRTPPFLSPGDFAGRTVRVTLRSRTLVCRSPHVTPAGIALPPSAPGGPGYGPPDLLPWTEVERIDVRGNSAGTGAVIGGFAVGLLGLALGAAVASDPFLGGDGSGIVAFTMLGVVAGAGAGAVVGATIPSWRNVWRRGASTDATRARR